MEVVWHWIKYQFFSRCFVCRRWMFEHSIWGQRRCENTPLPIRLTAKGWDRINNNHTAA